MATPIEGDLPDGREVADYLAGLFRKKDRNEISAFLDGFSPEEFRESREEYEKAFLIVMESRGLSGSAVDEIEKTNNAPWLEAQNDDEDGGIDLPPTLRDAFFAPYVGIRAPEEESRPVEVRNITLGFNQGRIEIEPKLIEYTEGKKKEGYITVAKNGKACCSIIAFDFNKGAYYVEIVRVNVLGSIVHEEGQDPEIIEEHKLTPDMMVGFASLLPVLGARENSRISISRDFLFKLPDNPDFSKT